MFLDKDTMFNKFKINEIVLCSGIGKCSRKFIVRKGKVVEKDYYFKDYCVKFDDGLEEWFDEKDLKKI